jgi:alkylated DNA repair protein (DNA oxidative demethylase)
MMLDLFSDDCEVNQEPEALAAGATLLRGLAAPQTAELVAAIHDVTERAPFRIMATRAGYHMSVAMTNCGAAGWLSDESGYRYDAVDPTTDLPWPPMPAAFAQLAAEAAERAGFGEFTPDACLLNRYEPGARLSLHQDKNERDMNAPIVSVSLGLPAVFLFGGTRRAQRPRRVPLAHGDVVVWGGPARLFYHGVLALKDGEHRALGRCRVNLTFRRAL